MKSNIIVALVWIVITVMLCFSDFFHEDNPGSVLAAVLWFGAFAIMLVMFNWPTRF